MERKISEVFRCNTVDLQVIPATSCRDCFFNTVFNDCNNQQINETGDCGNLFRKDKTSVIFKEVY